MNNSLAHAMAPSSGRFGRCFAEALAWFDALIELSATGLAGAGAT
jgi:hypothetical protein